MSDEDAILDTAIEQWGTQAQLDKAVEECGELIAALARDANGQATDDEIVDEIADVEIMVKQVKRIYGEDAVESHKHAKLERLAQRLTDDAIADVRGGDDA